MIRSYLDKLYIVILLTILSFDLKAQTYIYDGVYVGGGFHFFNWTFDEVNYKNDNGNGLSLNVGKNLSPEMGFYIGLDDSEIYNEKAFENSTFRPKKFLKNARILGEESLMFVVHPTLKKEHIDKTIDSIQEVYLNAAYHII